MMANADLADLAEPAAPPAPAAVSEASSVVVPEAPLVLPAPLEPPEAVPARLPRELTRRCARLKFPQSSWHRRLAQRLGLPDDATAYQQHLAAHQAFPDLPARLVHGLLEQGFLTREAVEAATDEDVLRGYRIGPQGLARIRQVLPAIHPASAPAEQAERVPCPLCAGQGLLQRPATQDRLLTARERQIVTLLASGATREEIATHLGLTPNTIKNLQVTAYTRLGARNGPHAVALALQAGLLDLRASPIVPRPPAPREAASADRR